MISLPICVPAFLSNCGRSQVQKTGCPAHSEFPWRVSWGPACESGSEQEPQRWPGGFATRLGCFWEEKLMLRSLSVGLCYRHQGNFLRRLGSLSRRVCSAPQAWFPCPLPSCFMGYDWAMPRSRLRVAKVTELEAGLPTAVLRPRRAPLVILTDSCRPTRDPPVSGVRMKTVRPSQGAPLL